MDGRLRWNEHDDAILNFFSDTAELLSARLRQTNNVVLRDVYATEAIISILKFLQTHEKIITSITYRLAEDVDSCNEHHH